MAKQIACTTALMRYIVLRCWCMLLYDVRMYVSRAAVSSSAHGILFVNRTLLVCVAAQTNYSHTSDSMACVWVVRCGRCEWAKQKQIMCVQWDSEEIDGHLTSYCSFRFFFFFFLRLLSLSISQKQKQNRARRNHFHLLIWSRMDANGTVVA